MTQNATIHIIIHLSSIVKSFFKVYADISLFLKLLLSKIFTIRLFYGKINKNNTRRSTKMKNNIEKFSIYSYNASDLDRLPSRPKRSNKGTFGRVLCVCGSVCMSGAAYLSAKAAYRMGAGLVEILTPECNRVILSTLLPEAIITTYSYESPEHNVIRDAKERADAIVIGCGLGTALSSKKVLCSVLSNTKSPCVIDADALNIIAKDETLFPLLKGKIITPHPAEMARLIGSADIESILDSAEETAYAFAKKYESVCVLKTHETVVSDGSSRIWKNNCGNSGMATGGSGDVLAGMIGGILAQMKNESKTDLTLAASLGVYIHALAGDCAAARLGERSVMASDIIDNMSEVLK